MADALPASSDNHEATTLVDVLSLEGLSPDASAYLTHLTTLPLASIVSEPPSLTSQSHHLTSSLTSLTHSSYPTFLSLHRTTTALSTSLLSLSTSLSTLLNTSLPALESSASSFKSTTAPILESRLKARTVLEQHDKLRDLLDIPLLIDSCVRNGYFAEALSLASHMQSLSSDDGAPPILLSIQAEVSASIQTMLHTLLNTLYEPNKKLPALWKAVNFLRRMEVLNEKELALALLIGRSECLTNALDAIGPPLIGVSKGEALGEREKEDVARYLKKYIDVWREGVYDIISQYSTIFLERSATVTNPLSPTKSSYPDSNSAPNPTLRPLLTTLTSHLLTTTLIPTLSAHLYYLPPSHLNSLLTQLSYCAAAFSRVGLDFRGVIGGIFEDAVRTSIKDGIREAGTSWVDRVSASRFLKPSKWLIVPSMISSPPLPAPEKSQHPPNIPPPILTSYPPIAGFTNALLGTLNSLRLLAPASLMHELLDILEGALAEGGRALLDYARSVDADEDGSERQSMGGEVEEVKEEKVMRAAGEVYVVVFVPFMKRALVEGVYGTHFVNRNGGTEGDFVREWEEWLKVGSPNDG